MSKQEQVDGPWLLNSATINITLTRTPLNEILTFQQFSKFPSFIYIYIYIEREREREREREFSFSTFCILFMSKMLKEGYDERFGILSPS